jgi:hypothetical protein
MTLHVQLPTSPPEAPQSGDAPMGADIADRRSINRDSTDLIGQLAIAL